GHHPHRKEAVIFDRGQEGLYLCWCPRTDAAPVTRLRGARPVDWVRGHHVAPSHGVCHRLAEHHVGFPDCLRRNPSSPACPAGLEELLVEDRDNDGCQRLEGNLTEARDDVSLHEALVGPERAGAQPAHLDRGEPLVAEELTEPSSRWRDESPLVDTAQDFRQLLLRLALRLEL